jgi:hypothetical protein
MPSFDDETVEKWRRERIFQSLGAKPLRGWTDWQVKTAWSVNVEDTKEERDRLARAEQQVALSRKALANLADNHIVLLREMERRRGK